MKDSSGKSTLKYILQGLEQVYMELEEYDPLIMFGFSPKIKAWKIDCIVPSGNDHITSRIMLLPEEIETAVNPQVVVRQNVGLMVDSIKEKLNSLK